MKKLKISIQGTTPLLCNRFTDEAQMKATNGTTTALTGDKGTPRQQAEKKLYLSMTAPHIPVIPQPNLFRAIIDAGKYFKAGKSKVTTQKSSIIPACLEIEGTEIAIQSKEDWQVDTRPVRIPSTGGRILAHRPMFHDWRLTFTVNLDTEMISEGLFREMVDAAGRQIGLGDFRPDCKGPYGKFVVVEWAED